ncbi:uncharacterized protein LOC106661577 [Cimex lectularius]|uniref:Uncharacterized protein n=1 Tax=Cimex lectularius TaxID=79782 RepID=A0A8I6RB38_CIMLE|nr:uncharacterized protein LOC106661577 [Cimex lectularius]
MKMVSIPQSKLMSKYRFLEGYNDVKTCRDARQAASNVVNKTMAFAEMCFNEEIGFKSCQSTLLLHDDSWPTVAEFNIFAALPKIDAFMKYTYPWLSNWPHSTRHLKEIIVSKNLSFHVFEVCYGAARISYPVVQTTFSVYFVFEINRLVDQGSDCIVKYFLEGSDEELIPYVNDNITQPRVKALLKVKLALSSTINLGSTVQMSDDTIRQLIHMKKQMLKDFRFVTNTAASHETIPFPYTVHIQLNEKCSVHGKNCPIFRVKSQSYCTGTTHLEEDEEEDIWTLSSDSLSRESFERYSFYDSLDTADLVKDAVDESKTKNRSRTVSIRTLSPGVYEYDYDYDNDNDNAVVFDKKNEDEFDLEYDFDDDDDKE